MDIICILKRCPHKGYGRCELLGQCGAAYAVQRAECGYRVRFNDNPTVRALKAAGLITIEAGSYDQVGVVYAKCSEATA